MIAATTGMRAGEVRGLQWGDLDPKAGIIHIRRALENKSSRAGLPKWGKIRVCPYPKVLQRLVKKTREPGAPEEWVFAWGEDGEEALNYSRWKTSFHASCASAGVSTTLHGLRHTLNTVLLIRGIPDAVIRAAPGACYGWHELGEGRGSSAGRPRSPRWPPRGGRPRWKRPR